MNRQEIKELIEIKNGLSGRMYNEKYIKNNYEEIYEKVIFYCNEKLNNLAFKEKVYHFIHDISENVICKNPNCNNPVKFKNSTHGYYDYCSNRCIGTDPYIQKIKEEKSYEKYGTKAPSMSKGIKDKMIKTNIEKYGGNSPKNDKNVINKSTKTFYETKRNKNLKKYEKYKNVTIIDVDYDNRCFTFKCDKGHDFKIDLWIFSNRKKIETEICTVCNPINSYTNSGFEIQLQDFIKSIYDGEILLNNRDIIGKEMDIYIPALKIAFEFNGVYWHNELYKSNNFHLEKTESAEKNGIKLIHIYQDDWIYKKDIVKSRILNIFKKSEKIMARKCIIKEINDNDLIRKFLDKHHLQGFVGSQIKIGLFYKKELVSLMTFGKQRKSMGKKSIDGTFEMLRFCNKLNTNVIGGASKIFSYFIKKYNPLEIISYADRSWSQGNLYEKLGFNLYHKTKPSYFYVVDGVRRYRFLFRKDILIKEGFDKNKTEHEIMLERKIYRIYDSGHLKYVYKKKEE